MTDKKESPFSKGFPFALPALTLSAVLGLGSYDFARHNSDNTHELLSVLQNAGSAVAAETTDSRVSKLPTHQPQAVTTQALWQSKEIRGIYLSRYQVTGSTREETIRDRVRYYKSQGINTIIHGVWGNGCPMYNSEVMQDTFGIKSCPNAFNEDWLDWLIDEAHKQGMQVHAYFEKGIKLDEDSPIFERAVANHWFVPGIDRTYASVEHYILDVDKPAVSTFFSQISAEFVRKYPTIDAVQWDDYLGYHADLPGSQDRTASLTRFVQRLRTSVKQANPSVSFDLCHHNPYWSSRYFAADWTNWDADRAFIQVYNDNNFQDELAYAEEHSGVAITENQLHRLDELVKNENIESILIFPSQGNPEEAAGLVKNYVSGR